MSNPFRELADWWTGYRQQYSEIIESDINRMLARHPNQLGVIAATMAHTFFEFPVFIGEGYVDLLRLGEGIERGGWDGVAEDALRAVGIAGVLGEAIGLGSRLASGAMRGIQRLFKLPDPGGPNCLWMAAAAAVRETATKWFATVDDLLRAGPFPMQLPNVGMYVREIIPQLRQLGARLTLLPNAASWDDVFRAAYRLGNGVLIFTVRWTHQGRTVGHALVMRATVLGFKIRDRTGRVVQSLAELERFYPGISGATAVRQDMVFVHNAEMAFGDMARRAGQVAAGLHFAGDHVMIKGDEIGLLVRSLGLPPPDLITCFLDYMTAGAAAAEGAWQRNTRPGGRLYRDRRCTSPAPERQNSVVCVETYYYRVVEGDTLAVLARAVYGDGSRWPLIYEANLGVLGPDRSRPRLRPGQVLLVPPPPGPT